MKPRESGNNNTRIHEHDTNTTLITFNMPYQLKYRADRLCKFKNISRTALLNNLLETWVREEQKAIEDDERIYELMSKMENTIERSVLRVEEVKREEENPKRWEDSY